jgi:hypothetical protein
MSLFHDRIKETTTTTGASDITLAGAVSQFVAFTTRYAVNEVFYYAIVGQTGTEWEVGKGHLSSSTVLVRDRVFESSNSDAVVTLSAGTKDVFVSFIADRGNEVITKGQSVAQTIGAAMP